MGARAEGLSGFLRARRNQLRPADVGLVETGRRRVPGLRREELAYLAGVSTDYLVRLEQGRDLHPSRPVLDALATALRLDQKERAYLYLLADTTDIRECGHPGPAQQVSLNSQKLLDAVPDAPALVLGRNLNVLAQNRAAIALLGCLSGRNLLRALVLDARFRALYIDWEQTTSEMIGLLRDHILNAGADAELCQLVPDLSSDPTFARLWTTHRVPQTASGTTRFAHPDMGGVTLDYQVLHLPDPAQWVLLYTPNTHAARDTHAVGDAVAARPPELTSLS